MATVFSKHALPTVGSLCVLACSVALFIGLCLHFCFIFISGVIMVIMDGSLVSVSVSACVMLQAGAVLGGWQSLLVTCLCCRKLVTYSAMTCWMC